jgi:hypothetical protein
VTSSPRLKIVGNGLSGRLYCLGRKTKQRQFIYGSDLTALAADLLWRRRGGFSRNQDAGARVNSYAPAISI